jgi:hypothetical protein
MIKVSTMLEAMAKRIPQGFEPPWLVRVVIWGELHSLLEHQHYEHRRRQDSILASYLVQSNDVYFSVRAPLVHFGLGIQDCS